MLKEQRGEVESMEFKKEKNVEYDKDFANIGKNEK